MTWPLVSVKTPDRFTLHGLFIEPKKRSDTVLIHVHGTAGNFYGNAYYKELATAVVNRNMAFLATNNRGAYVYEIEKDTTSYGCALEHFEDCVRDIDAWLNFAFEHGYTGVILAGHSFGNEKVVYYLNHGRLKDMVEAVILLGIADTYGNEMRQGKDVVSQRLDEAQSLVRQGRGEVLLGDLHGISMETPVSADTYVNFFSPGSELAKTLPLREGENLLMYRNIKVPILVVISDDEANEYTIIPIKQALELVKKESPLTQTQQISGTNHGFKGKETELTQTIAEFLTKQGVVG